MKVIIDKRVIYGISAFFAVIFIILLGILLFPPAWYVDSANLLAEYKMPSIRVEKLLNSRYIMIFYFADAVLALYILDSLFRKRLPSK